MRKHAAEQFTQFVTRPGMISGIYNYCDRWCERCAMTARCSVHAVEQGDPYDAATDESGEEFWNRLHGLLESTVAMLKELAEKEGIDLDAVADEVAEKDEKETAQGFEYHPLMQAAVRYRIAVQDWFARVEDDLFRKPRELERIHVLGVTGRGVPGIDAECDVLKLKDLIDDVRWYHTLIPAKIARALISMEDEDSDAPDEYPSDADGSAKVALIAMDRSLLAWSRMRDHVPEREDEILALLLQLEQLRRFTERLFPRARLFVRPGFDTEEPL